MELRRFFVEGLAHASYLVACLHQKVAAVIDPQRDIQPYLDAARQLGVRITDVFLTHLHADFVAGHMDLVAETGARVWVSKDAAATFPHQPLVHDQVVRVGQVAVRALATPGHSPESMCFVATAAGGGESKVFTGDTLFIGDVGRPDLWGRERAQELAGQLFESITGKLFCLGEGVTVAPAHGAGSLCGKNLSSEPFSTLGRERQGNCSIAGKDKAAFVRDLLDGIPEAPPQFPRNARTNQAGPTPVRQLPAPVPLEVAAVAARLRDGAWLLDVRSADDFKAGHVPGSLFLGSEASSHTWASWLVSPDVPLILLANDTAGVDEARRKLLRVGFDRVVGFVQGGMAAWSAAGQPVARLRDVQPRDYQALRQGSNAPPLIDVRQPGEWRAGHAPGARNLPLGTLPRHVATLRAEGPLAVMCQGGYRSVIGCSVLLRGGKADLVNIPGGFRGWSQAGLAVERHDEPKVTP